MLFLLLKFLLRNLTWGGAGDITKGAGDITKGCSRVNVVEILCTHV
jgi:hypothetical protein